MALTGIQITDLTPIGNALVANYVMPIVNLSVDETQKVTLQNLGNFILGNLANSLSLTVSNLTVSNNTILNSANIATANISGNANISGSTNIAGSANITGNLSAGNANVATGNVLAGSLFTDNLLYANGAPWNLTNAAGNLGEVQFSNGNGNFTASNVFVWNTTSNTLNIQNLNLVYANTDTNQGTVQQVLGIVDQTQQTIGWKTLPTNYMNVHLRVSNTIYISSITPVLRVIPIKARNAPTGYVQIPAA